MRDYQRRIERLEQHLKPGCTCGGPGLVILRVGQSVPNQLSCALHPDRLNNGIIVYVRNASLHEREVPAQEYRRIAVNLPRPGPLHPPGSNQTRT